MATSNPIVDNGINIIPCNKIYSESIRLKGMFRNCKALDEKDMHDILSLIYSVSLCNSGDGPGIQQDNIVIFINTPSTAINSMDELNMANIVNAMPQFIVDDTQLVIFKTSVNISKGDGRIDIQSVYHTMVNTGRGVYGVGGQVLTNDNFFLLRSNTIATIGNIGTNTILYDIRTSDINIYNNSPHQALNASMNSFPIVLGNDYYFRITLDRFSNNIGSESSYKVYRFKGAVGNYGILGGDTAILDDFIPYGSDNGNLNNQFEKGLSIRTLVIPTIVDTSQKIHNIINSGPWNTIRIASDELVSFVIRRRHVSGYSVTLITEKYHWKNGSGTINRDSLESDFDLYETSMMLNMVGTTSPAAVISGMGDISQPQDTFNSLEQSIVKTSTNQILLAVNDEIGRVGIYEFIGEPGTYGAGNKTSTLSDFELKADDNTSVEPIIDIEAGADIAIDKSNPRKPKISYTGNGVSTGTNISVIDIGPWSMPDLFEKTVSHGVDVSKWRSIRVLSVQVSNNEGSLHYEAMHNMKVIINQNAIMMVRINDIDFMTSDFSGEDSGNRGWITIIHD